VWYYGQGFINPAMGKFCSRPPKRNFPASSANVLPAFALDKSDEGQVMGGFFSPGAQQRKSPK